MMVIREVLILLVLGVAIAVPVACVSSRLVSDT